jgi:penicillin-binding protein-related factor A (putative recombinase)
MDEIDFNRIIVSSVKDLGGFAQKMPDPSRAEVARGAPKRPYDLYFAYKGRTTHIESKFLKIGYQAFNLKRIEDHQYDNLILISKNTDPFDAIVAVAVWEPRKIFDAFFFTIQLLDELRKKMTSINKKTLLALKDAGYALSIKKDMISIDSIREVTLCRSDQIPWR